jgi:hypothetical protein
LRYLKGIVFFLALANVGYYLYVRGIAPPPPQPQPAPVASGRVPAVEEPAPATTAISSHCVSIGPFGELADSARAEATLRGGGYVPRQRSAQGELQEGVFVFIPIPETAAAAAMLRKIVKGAGFTDAPDVRGPNSSTVISLGVFNDPKRAQARLSQAQKAGLGAQSIERKRAATLYWLDIDMKPTDGPLNPADLRTDSARGTQLGVTECPAAPAAVDVHTASVAR